MLGVAKPANRLIGGPLVDEGLSTVETNTLVQLKVVIETHLRHFIEVGQALTTIRDSRHQNTAKLVLGVILIPDRPRGHRLHGGTQPTHDPARP